MNMPSHATHPISNEDVAKPSKSLLGKSFIAVIVRLASSVANFFSFVLLAKVLGAEQFGFYSADLSLAMLLSFVLSFGVQNFIFKQVIKYQETKEVEKEKGVFVFVFSLVALMFFVIGGGYLLSRPVIQMSDWVIVFVGFFIALTQVTFSYLRVIDKTLFALITRELGWRLFIIFACLMMLLFNLKSDFTTLLSLSAIILCVTTITHGRLIARYYRSTFKEVSLKIVWSDYKEWWAVCLGLFIMSVITAGDSFLFTYVVDKFYEPLEVGAFFAALKVAEILSLGFMSVVLMFSNLLSKAAAKSDIKQIQATIDGIHLLVFVPTLCLAMFVWWQAEWILSFFAPEYAQYGFLLRLFSLATLINAVFGPNLMFMQLSGLHWVMIRIQLVGLLISLIVFICSGLFIGILGAAISYVLFKILWNIGSTLYIYKHFKIDTSILTWFFDRHATQRLKQSIHLVLKGRG